MQEEASEDDEVDSDFDVDESTWNQEEDGEQQLQLMEQKKKKKQWLKPTKPKVTCHGTWEGGGEEARGEEGHEVPPRNNFIPWNIILP